MPASKMRVKFFGLQTFQSLQMIFNVVAYLAIFCFTIYIAGNNKTGFQPFSRTYGTESGIFYRGKSEVSLVLKLCQQPKFKSLIFQSPCNTE